MKVVKESDVDWAPRNPNSHRAGHIDFKFLLIGEEGSLENYKLSLTKSDGHFTSPRHRHNFDQIRIPLEGRMSVHPKVWLHPGEVGYFPEGTFYGPQEDVEPFLAAVLQCGGASGNGYISRRQSRLAQDALAQLGRFEGGEFHPEETKGVAAPSQDGFEAVWEHAMSKKLKYPQSKYDRPIHMAHEHFDWRSTDTAGVWRKTLGVFTEREMRLEMLKLAPGAQYTLTTGRAIDVAFVYSGTGTCGGQTYGVHTAVETTTGEKADFSAQTETIILRISMPLLSH